MNIYGRLRESIWQYTNTDHTPIRKTKQARVNKGAKMLDKVLPGWWNGLEAQNLIAQPDGHMIDLSRLDLANMNNCVLGQLFADNPSNTAGYDFVQLLYPTTVRYGFNDTDDYSLSKLTRMWSRLIKGRRLAASAAIPHDSVVP